jgi:hypothetical protein
MNEIQDINLALKIVSLAYCADFMSIQKLKDFQKLIETKYSEIISITR